jgi:uncharacterized protein
MKSIKKSVNRGKKAYKNFHYSKAISNLTPAAEAGNSEAQYYLGEIYMRGSKDVYQNEEIAWNWYRKAADQGHFLAMANLLVEDMFAKTNNQTNLPTLDDIEHGKTLNDVMEKLVQNAENNCCESLSLLGSFSLGGLTGEIDLEKSALFYKRAMDLGDVQSKVMYAIVSSSLINGSHDYQALETLLVEAFDDGSCALAGLTLGRYYLRGSFCKPNTLMGYNYLVEAATQGDPDAALEVGHCKANGIGTKQNEQKAYKWYLVSSKRGNRKAFYYLSQIDRYLPSINVSDEQKHDWLYEAARQGYPPAMTRMAWILITRGRHDDERRQGFKLLVRAVEQNEDEAQFRLGMLYYNGDFVRQDDGMAAKLWYNSAENGNPDGQARYGFTLFYGTGVERNEQASEYYFQKAFDQGVAAGAIGLGYVYHYVKHDHVNALAYLEYAMNRVNGEGHSQVYKLINKLRHILSKDEAVNEQQVLNHLETRFYN